MTVKEIYGTDFPVILAPMAGITDLPFRILCKEQGADVMVTEMISAKALFYGNKNTLPLMQTEGVDQVPGRSGSLENGAVRCGTTGLPQFVHH